MNHNELAGRLVSKDKEVYLKPEDKTSGELFAKCSIDKYPHLATFHRQLPKTVLKDENSNKKDLRGKTSLRKANTMLKNFLS
ncbi:hypothetical protein O3M35_000288 [Rhynocoris fuscipes]|uniref:Uncharacterized protein n=1 Tax=Rhynocoris fuscipes TaxID=488301 RepID=A0AAW1DKZ7_9HEMI